VHLTNERAVREARYLLSFAVNDDWSFEVDFHKRVPGAKILCFDHSVSKDVLREKCVVALNEILSARFLLGALALNFRGVRNKFQALKRAILLRSRFHQFASGQHVAFYSKGVSNIGNSKFFTIGDVFGLLPPPEPQENSVFIKMDIEQAEFRVLAELAKYYKYVSGMVIEFHDLDILWPNLAAWISQLKETFVVAHLHGNNYCELIPNSKTLKLLEITLLKRDLVAVGTRRAFVVI
jgi:hypothetical protein